MTVASVFLTARNMKHFRLLLITLCVLTFSCNRYDDSPIWSELQDLKDRIARLEALCKTMNSNISALEDIVAALQDNDYITDIYPLTENGVELGYKISFSKSGSITIYHGSDGPPGQDGADGTDGADGSDGHTPSIGVRKAEDGIYYWTLDGEWLLDADGNKIPTTGKDGADGEDGTDGTDGADGSDGTDGLPGAPGEPGKNGADGITPLLKIEDNYWYISYDNGLTWEKLYKAVGENGVDGADGSDGIPGKDGTSFFQSVDTSDPNYLTLILSDGTQIKIPTWKAFEELQASINRMNTNLTALQNIIEALQNKDYVTDIAVAIEGGQEVGYIIYFSKSQPVTIYHGKNGNDGSDGADGSDGSDGVDGSNGHTPVIGIRQGTDEDLSLDSGWIGDPDEDFYWTIDGEWLLDADGNKIPANGQNGITPLLKIEDGRWYVSTDGGRSWKDEGPATGSDIESIFTEITYDNNYLYITLSDGERIILSRHQEKLGIACSAKPVEITDKTVRFSGHLDVPSDDLIYSSVTLYYSDIEPFSIYTAESVSTATFDYNRNFSISVTSLRPETTYTYCIYASGKYDELYGPVQSFTTLEEALPEDEEHLETCPIIWSNQKYLNTIGLVTDTRRAMAQIPAKANDIFKIKGMSGFTHIDIIAIREDGSTSGYTNADNYVIWSDDGSIAFIVPATPPFTSSDIAYVGLTFKTSPTEASIDISTLPADCYNYSAQPDFSNERYDTRTSSFVADNTRLATKHIEIKENRTISISNLPDAYTALEIVDAVIYDSVGYDYMYSTYDSGHKCKAIVTGNTMTIDLSEWSNASIGRYVRITFRRSDDPSQNISAFSFINCTIESN